MRLIDTDALKEALTNWATGELARPTWGDIENAPTIEAERKRGEWRHYEGMLFCSECKTEFYDDIMEHCGDRVPAFCPNCGADMRDTE